MHNFTEDTSITGVRKTNDGYLTGLVDCARTGIQEYNGSELGINDADVIRMYRPESVVFDASNMATFVGKPATNDHPPITVDAESWKDYAVGSIGEDVIRNGDFIRVPLVLMDGATIQQVENGKRELSMGYGMDFEIKSGTTPDGEKYDAIMTDYAINHIAVVDRGRAGSKARIGDNQNWGISPLTNDGKKPMTTQTIVVDGISIETTTQGAQAIDKLKKEIESSTQTLADLKKANDSAIAEKDKELALKDTEIENLKKEILTPDALDAKIQEKAVLLDNAKKLAKDADFKGMTDAEIIKTAVTAVRGADAVDGKSEAYLEATFDALLDLHQEPDAFQDAMKNRKPVDTTDNGQKDYQDRMQNAWKNKEVE